LLKLGSEAGVTSELSNVVKPKIGVATDYFISGGHKAFVAADFPCLFLRNRDIEPQESRPLFMR
jgi:hypothetical protein